MSDFSLPLGCYGGGIPEVPSIPIPTRPYMPPRVPTSVPEFVHPTLPKNCYGNPLATPKSNKLFDMFFSSKVTPAQTQKLIGYGSGLSLAFTVGSGVMKDGLWGGIKSLFSFDGLLSVAGVASLFCPALMPFVAGAYLAKAAFGVAGAVGSLLSGNITGFLTGLLGAAATAACAVPLGKLAGLKGTFNALRAGEISGGKALAISTRHLYGREAQRQMCSFMKAPTQQAALSVTSKGRDGFWSAIDWFMAGRSKQAATQFGGGLGI